MAIDDERRSVRCHAERLLFSVCHTLLTTSPTVVRSITVSVPQQDTEANRGEWECAARMLGEQFELKVDISVPRDQLRVRFTRYLEQESRTG